LFNLLTIALIIGTAELLARTLAPRPADALFSDDMLRVRGNPFAQKDARLGFSLTPGYTDELTGIRINSSGFRGEDLPPELDRFDVALALGDSTTFGWRVVEGDDYPSQLRQQLELRSVLPRPYVINAGVPSYSSSQVLLRLQHLLPELRPRFVIVSVMWNDIWYSAVPNWYPELLVSQQPSAWVRFLVTHSGVYRALALSDPTETLTIHRQNEQAIELYRQNLHAMIDACQQAGAQLFFLQAPFDLGHVKPRGILLRKMGMRFSTEFLLDISRRYRTAATAVFSDRSVPVIDHRLAGEDSRHREWFLDHLHPNREGNLAIAEDVAAFLASWLTSPATDTDRLVERQ
jgi:lysophospholipase L1-like esterase